MTKSKAPRYRSGRCVHCLQQSEEINDDHVIPSAWYPDDTPTTVNRRTAPSCARCNTEHGKIEQNLLIRLGVCIDPEDLRAIGISAKALRSIQPGAGKNPRDKVRRLKKLIQVLRQTEIRDTPTPGVELPGFGPYPNTQYPKYVLVPVAKAELITLGRKIIRGIIYNLEKRFIEDDKEDIDIFFLEDEHSTIISERIRRNGKTFEIAPGVTVSRWVDNFGGMFFIGIWEKLKLFGSLSPKGSER